MVFPFVLILTLSLGFLLGYLIHAPFRQIVQQAQIGICKITPDGTISYVNPWMVEILGYSPQEMISHSLFEFMDAGPEAHPHFATRLEGLTEQFDFRFRHKSGRNTWLKVAGKPLKNRRGQVVGILAVMTDITPRKQLEQDLHRSRAYFEAIANTQQDLICRYTPQGIMTFVNQAYCNFHGKSELDLLGKSIFAHTSPQLPAHIANLLANPRVVYSDWQGINAQGEERWLRWCDQVIFDADGQALEIQGSAHDITEQRRFEAHLQALNTQLAQKSHALEAFTYSVSHDLRAPLRAIAGYSNILTQDSALPETAQHYLHRIQKNASQMSALIDGLLRLSRLGQQHLDLKPLDLNPIVENILAEMQEQGQIPPNLDFQHDPLPQVWGDASLLKQVFVNLLSNAFKFSRQSNPPKVKIRYTDNIDEHIFSVQDNGVGFDMDYKDKLFGVFQTLHSRQEFEGTGIGLAITHRIITRHGGRIWATSAQGATFFFSLPKETHGHSAD